MTSLDLDRERAFEVHENRHLGDPVPECRFCEEREVMAEHELDPGPIDLAADLFDSAVREFSVAEAKVHETALQLLALLVRREYPTATGYVLRESDTPNCGYWLEAVQLADGSLVEPTGAFLDETWMAAGWLENADLPGSRPDGSYLVLI